MASEARTDYARSEVPPDGHRNKSRDDGYDHRHRHSRHQGSRDRSRDSDRHHGSRERHRSSKHHRSERVRHRKEEQRRSRSPDAHRSHHGSRRRADEVVESNDDGEWVIPGDDEFQVDPTDRFRNTASTTAVDDLNKLKAELMRAKLKGDKARAVELEHEFAVKEKEMIKGAKERLRVLDTRFVDKDTDTKPEDKTITDMVREEINSRGRGDRHEEEVAKVIAANGGYENDEDYLFDNAEVLAGVSQKTHSARREAHAKAKKESNTRNRLVEQSRREHEALDTCPLCLDNESRTKATTVSVATRAQLALAPSPAMTRGVAVISPLEHRKNTLECDDDEWEEIRNFMKSLVAMWNRHGRSVIFYENAVDRSIHAHAHIYAVPIPRGSLASVPGFFGTAFQGGEDEWRSHRDVIDTQRKAQTAGKYAFRTSIAKEAPYFHVWFDINGGTGHIVEDTRSWPRGDGFARSIVGGILDSDPILARQSTKWHDVPPAERDYFEKRWKAYDWTKDIQW